MYRICPIKWLEIVYRHSRSLGELSPQIFIGKMGLQLGLGRGVEGGENNEEPRRYSTVAVAD